MSAPTEETPAPDTNPVGWRARVSSWLAPAYRRRTTMIAAALFTVAWSFRPPLTSQFRRTSDVDTPRILSHLEDGISWWEAAGWFVGDWVEGNGFYRPLPSVSYALDFLAAGSDARIYYLTQFVWFLVNGLLLFVLCAELFGHLTPAFCAVIVYNGLGEYELLHWPATRADAMAAAFCLAALVAWVRYLDDRLGWAPTVAWFLLGLMSKEFALVLPALAIVFAIWRRGRRLPWLPLLLLWVMAGGYVAFRTYVCGLSLTSRTTALPYFPRAAVQVFLEVMFPQLMAAVWWTFTSPWSLWFLATRMAWRAIGLWCVVIPKHYFLLRHHLRDVIFISLWKAIAYAPTYTSHYASDHYRYFPSMGEHILAGLALWRALQWVRSRRRRRAERA